jgi:hypothetical protein
MGTWMVMASIFAVTFLVMPWIYVSEDMRDSELEAMKFTSFNDLTPGERAKVCGAINSTTTVVISGKLVKHWKYSDWIWTTTSFYLDQGNISVWVDASSFNGKESGNIRDGLHPNKEYYAGDNITVIGSIYGTTGHFGIAPEHITPTPVGFHDYSYTGIYIFFGALELILWSFFASGIYIEMRRRSMAAANAEGYNKRMRPLEKEEKDDIKKTLSEWPSKEKCPICGYPLASYYLGNVECISCGKKMCKFDSLRAKREAKGRYYGHCTACYRILLKEDQASSPLVKDMKERTRTISWIQEEGRQTLLKAVVIIASIFIVMLISMLLVVGSTSDFFWVFLFIGILFPATFTAVLVWTRVKVLFIEVSSDGIALHDGKGVRSAKWKDIKSASFRPTFGLQGTVVLQTNTGEVLLAGKSGSLSFDMAVETLGALAARGVSFDDRTKEWFKWTERFVLEREPFEPCPTCGDPVVKKFGAKLCRRCEKMKKQSGM